MRASGNGFPKPPHPHDSSAQAIVRLLEKHVPGNSLLREILVAIEARKREGRQKARLALLEHLLEGQPPITEEELAAVRDE